MDAGDQWSKEIWIEHSIGLEALYFEDSKFFKHNLIIYKFRSIFSVSIKLKKS